MFFQARREFVWRLRSREVTLGLRTLVMGILNVTPDSFSDGGMFAGVEAAVARGVGMLDEGADLLDVGGESTRPGAVALSVGEEQDRVLPVVEGILKERPGAVVSVDTYHAAMARAAVKAGAEIVNDVSGGLWDGGMVTACAEMGCGLVLMHTRGRPGEWAGLAAMEDVVGTVVRELGDRVAGALAAGVGREAIMVDPGFGFGKVGGENFALLAGLGGLREPGFPVLAGVSRKGFLGQAVAEVHGGRVPGAGERERVTVAANVAAVLGGAHVLRVHDVVAGLEGAAVADAVLRAGL